MSTQSVSFGTITRQPSAFVPVTMSLLALTLVAIQLVRYGITRQMDEGTTAHLWQLLMAGQLPVVAFFLYRWLRKSPLQALEVLALQVGAGLASMAPVFFLNW